MLFLVLSAMLTSPSPSPTAQPASQQTKPPLEDEALELHKEYRDLLASLAPTGWPDAWLVSAYRERFEALADRGSLRATAWLVQVDPPPEPTTIATSAKTDATRLRAHYERLATGATEAPWILREEPGILGALRADAGRLGRKAARELARSFRALATDDETRASALLAEAEAEFGPEPGFGEQAKPRARRRALALLRALRSTFPHTASAAEADDVAWRLEHLVAGTVAPDFVARDVDGNELRLSDLNGRPVVVHFWSLEEARRAPGLGAMTAADLDRWTRWIEARETADVVLLGVHLGDDERAFRHALAENDVEWPTAFTDPAADDVPWHIRRRPATFVVDARGVLRFATFEGALDPALAGALESVLAALDREQSAASAVGSDPRPDRDRLPAPRARRDRAARSDDGARVDSRVRARDASKRSDAPMRSDASSLSDPAQSPREAPRQTAEAQREVPRGP